MAAPLGLLLLRNRSTSGRGHFAACNANHLLKALSCLYSSVAECQSCKLKVLGSIPSGGFVLGCSTGAGPCEMQKDKQTWATSPVAIQKACSSGSQASQAVQAEFLKCITSPNCLYSSVAERQSCKLQVLGSIPSGGFVLSCVTGLLLVRSSTSRLSYLAACNSDGLLHWQPGKPSITSRSLLLRCSSQLPL